MNFRNRVIFLSSIGFALGIVIGTVITAVTTTMSIADGKLYICVPEFTEFIGNELLAFVIQSILSGVIGIAGMGGSAVYSIEEWSLLRATVSHFIPTVSVFFAVSFFLKWLSFENKIEIFIMLAIYIATYCLIWLSQYFSYKLQIEEINKDLELWKARTTIGGGA